MYNVPAYEWVLVLIGAIGIPATTCVVLYRRAIAAGLTRRDGARVAIGAGAVFGVWIVLSALLADADVYHQDPDGSSPWLGTVFVGVAFAGALVGLLQATRIPLIRRILADPGTPARLTVPHSLRVVGAVFLIAMAQRIFPAIFALPAGLGDIAIGIAAPIVALRLAHQPAFPGATRFNVLGILDLVVAITLGVLVIVLGITPSTEPLGLLPFALVPTVAVPTAIALHLVSLGRLRAARGLMQRTLRAAA